MPDRKTVVAVLLAIVIASAVGFVATAILAEFDNNVEADAGDVTNKRIAAESQFVDVGEQNVHNVTVRDSTGQGLYMGYDESRVEATNITNMSTLPMTLSAWGELGSNASVANDYYLVAVGNGSAVLQYRDGKWVGYANNSTHGGKVSVNASSPKAALTQVALRANATHVELWVNGSRQNTTAITQGGGDVESAVTWHGRVDEIRSFNARLSDSQMATLHSSPVGGLEGNSNTGRLMLDEGSGTTTYVIYAQTNADLVGDVQWANGKDGQVLDEGADYKLDKEAGEIKAASGGKLDGAPVAYVSYEQAYGQATNELGNAFVGAMGLLEIVFTAMLLAVAIIKMRTLES